MLKTAPIITRNGLVALTLSTTLVMILLTLLIPINAHAALVAAYDSTIRRDSTVKMKSSDQEARVVQQIIFREDHIAFQLLSNDLLVKEVGINLTDRIYYHADLREDQFYKMSWDRLIKEYVISQNVPVTDIEKDKTTPLLSAIYGSKAPSEVADYTIEIKKTPLSFNFNRGQMVSKYKIKFGEGDGWFKQGLNKKIKLKTINTFEGQAMYQMHLTQLRREFAFYKGMNNEFSDIILLMMVTEGLPLEAYIINQIDIPEQRHVITTTAKLAHLKEERIPNNQLVYFESASRFLNVQTDDNLSPQNGNLLLSQFNITRLLSKPTEFEDIQSRLDWGVYWYLYIILGFIGFRMGGKVLRILEVKRTVSKDPTLVYCRKCLNIMDSLAAMCPKCKKPFKP